MQEQPVLALSQKRITWGPTQQERVLLTAATVYTGCTLCPHSMCASVGGRQPVREQRQEQNHVLAKTCETG